jgi:hypothetical protein
LAGFVVLGLADLSLLERYLLVPSAMLALFAAVALGGWTLLPPSPRRRAWMVAAIPAGIWLALSLPHDGSELSRLSSALGTRGDAQRDLLHLPGEPGGSKLLARRCEPLALTGGGVLGSVALVRERRDSGIVFTNGTPPPGARLALIPRTSRAAHALGLPKGGSAPLSGLGLRVGARNRSWVLYSRC